MFWEQWDHIENRNIGTNKYHRITLYHACPKTTVILTCLVGKKSLINITFSYTYKLNYTCKQSNNTNVLKLMYYYTNFGTIISKESYA